jgi:hypothetical protein
MVPVNVSTGHPSMSLRQRLNVAAVSSHRPQTTIHHIEAVSVRLLSQSQHLTLVVSLRSCENTKSLHRRTNVGVLVLARQKNAMHWMTNS